MYLEIYWCRMRSWKLYTVGWLLIDFGMHFVFSGSLNLAQGSIYSVCSPPLFPFFFLISSSQVLCIHCLVMFSAFRFSFNFSCIKWKFIQLLLFFFFGARLRHWGLNPNSLHSTRVELQLGTRANCFFSAIIIS